MVILVDEQDRAIGVADKQEAHVRAWLHRAFSVFIFNSKNELLLQQRAFDKYHSPGLWTNTCCSHPMPGETVLEAASRRLKEEMGMEADLTHLFTFTYKAEFENQLTEHEIDHVFAGKSDALPVLDSTEVASFRYVDISSIQAEMEEHPERFTAWFRIIFNEYVHKL